MKAIRFTKMSGAGNDFIVLGPEYASLIEWAPAAARYLCTRRLAIGGDGLIIVERGTDGFFMHYFNSDGSRAAFCGNGARCLVRFCEVKGIASSPVTFRSEAGIHTGETTESGVRLSLERPVLLKETQITIGGVAYEINFIRAGVPHAVVLVEDIEGVDVEGLGADIRRHPFFGQEGANADFVAPSDAGSFAIRTYERGVESETLACGSGCVAAAHVLRLKGLAGDEIRLKVRSGAVLVAEVAADRADEVYLTGSAKVVYEGEITIDESVPGLELAG